MRKRDYVLYFAIGGVLGFLFASLVDAVYECPAEKTMHECFAQDGDQALTDDAAWVLNL